VFFSYRLLSAIRTYDFRVRIVIINVIFIIIIIVTVVVVVIIIIIIIISVRFLHDIPGRCYYYIRVVVTECTDTTGESNPPIRIINSVVNFGFLRRAVFRPEVLTTDRIVDNENESAGMRDERFRLSGARAQRLGGR